MVPQTLLCSEDQEERKTGIQKIIELRNEDDDTPRDLPGRPKIIAAVNQNATSVLELIDCSAFEKLVVNRLRLSLFISGLLLGFILSVWYKKTPRDYIFDKVYIVPNMHFEDEYHSKRINSTIASKMHDKIRVLCWVLTIPKNVMTKARHVNNTWGKRCNKLIFMSSETDIYLSAVALPVEEGRDFLWDKTREALKYVYTHYLDSYDWFLKADDDTYVIVENLRFMLMEYKPSDPIYFGCRFRRHVKQGYMSGGAGYVMSREAVRRFVEIGLTKPVHCKANRIGEEDLELGRCLEACEVVAGDSRDSEGRGRYFGVYMKEVLIKSQGVNTWFNDIKYHKTKQGMEGLSDYAVSFHYATPTQMYFLEYVIYHLRAFGLYHIPEDISKYIK